jgi:predicted nucleic acid-binding Zn ribbon protein
MAKTNRYKGKIRPLSSSRMREEILVEWRGAEEPANLNAGIHQAQQFIAAVLRSVGAEDGFQEDQIRAIWKQLAGDFIARHSEPVSVTSGQLVLRVTQPALRFQLEQMKPMLLARIRTELGETRIQSIKFQLG